jgi:SAM-dependent methyltransferase
LNTVPALQFLDARIVGVLEKGGSRPKSPGSARTRRRQSGSHYGSIWCADFSGLGKFHHRNLSDEHPGSVVLELGAGYGRDAYAILATNPGIKYVIVDIAPALWVAESYLRHEFPNLRIFCYRDFEHFADIEKDFLECDIAFFLSTQISRLPNGLADLVINVSSLHEMRLEQIGFYLSQFDRLLKEGRSFYFKQWKRGAVPFENVVIRQRDYPNWTRDLSREAPIQSKFFDERYRKAPKSG